MTTPLNDLPSMLTLEEAAPHLRCSRWALARAAERGEIRVVRLCRRILVPRTELERLLGLPPPPRPHEEGGPDRPPVSVTDAATPPSEGVRRGRD